MSFFEELDSFACSFENNDASNFFEKYKDSIYRKCIEAAKKGDKGVSIVITTNKFNPKQWVQNLTDICSRWYGVSFFITKDANNTVVMTVDWSSSGKSLIRQTYEEACDIIHTKLVDFFTSTKLNSFKEEMKELAKIGVREYIIYSPVPVSDFQVSFFRDWLGDPRFKVSIYYETIRVSW
jgi:hypothetical protein